jgi:hypothetical protein
MKNRKFKYSAITLITAMLITISMSCEREFDSAIPAEFPSDGDVFIDGFSAGLAYEAWGDVTAFEVDNEVTYKGEASMRFAVPDEGQTGGYAGGRFVTTTARNLTGYDALTFWAKATKAASIDIIGFGNNAEGSKYRASLNGVKVNTNWKKFIIPIPDATKLTKESGMLYYTESPEEGSGYTFWIDEVKFEKLGTIAHQKPTIFNGENQVNNTFNSVKIPTVGLSYVANLPNGINQVVDVAPSYFTFSSSDNGVASVDETGMVSVLSAGTAVISASMAGVEAEGSLTVESSGDFIHAPTPTVSPDSVISIFSNAYTNAPVEYYNGYWQPYQTTLSADFTIAENDVLNYTNFNFVGIQFTVPTINASDMTHLHLDVFIPNEVNPADKLQIRAVALGADGSFDDPNPTVSETLEGSTLVSKSWISLDIDLSSLASKNNLAQIVFDNLGSTLTNFYVDNIYLYNAGESMGDSDPTEAAPNPVIDEANVISIYGDAYSNLEGTDYPDWGQTTVVSDVSINGNNALKFAGFNYQGIQLASSLNVSNMEYLHLDFWTTNSTALNVYLISSGGEAPYALTVPTTGWTSIDIPLSAFSVDLADIIQLKFDGNGVIYLDNIYFGKEGGSTSEGPTTAAPTPTKDAANVVSVYSDAFDDIAFDNFDAGWCGGAAVTPVTIDGNNTLKKNAGIDCHGIDFSSNKLDLSEYTHIHFDFYTDDTDLTGDVFNVKLVDFGGGSAEASNLQININTGTTPGIVAGAWVSVDVDITSLGGVVAGSLTRSDIAQIGITTANLTNVWYDNIYFYKDGGSNANEPTSAAPTPPTREAEDVISLFSNAYTNSTVGTWSADWDDSDVAEVQIAGDDVKKYSFANFAGVDFSNNKFDASEMTHFHMDIWTPDAVQDKSLTVKMVDFGGGNAEASSFILTVVHTTVGDIPALATGSWVSIDVPLSAFSGDKTRSDLAQMVLSCNIGNVYIDNVYFYKSGGGGPATEPTAAAPAPPARDAAEVVSIFSDAYTDLAGTDFNPGWGQSTAVSFVDIEGNSTMMYANFNYQGTVLATPQDLTGMDYLHVDMWTADATVVQVTPINNSGSPAEQLVSLTPVTPGQWKSYDIPLTSFTSSGMALDGVFQMKFDGQAGNTPSTIYLDNIYFYKSSGGGGGGDTGPTAAAPTPPARDAENVVSIFSDAYSNISTDNFDAGWCGGAAITQVSIAGNNTLKKNSGIDCHGIDFSSNRQDLSSFTHIHFDFYTDDTDLTGDVFNIKLVDFAGGNGEASALEVNINTGTTPAIVAGTWVSVDIDITSLGGIVTGSLTRSDIAQIGITTANLTNVWYDNIYLYK